MKEQYSGTYDTVVITKYPYIQTTVDIRYSHGITEYYRYSHTIDICSAISTGNNYDMILILYFGKKYLSHFIITRNNCVKYQQLSFV